MTMGAAAITLPFAEPLVRLLFGGDFEPAGATTRALLAGLPAYAVLGIGWHALIATGRERELLRK
jgi:O-antigen/teichoic acid export membrane protein